MVAIGIGVACGATVSFALPYMPDVAWPARADGPPAPIVVSDSTVTLTSTPEGANVWINGREVGRTPISLRLPVGVHVAELRSGALSRNTSLTVAAGQLLTQHVDFSATPATGGLEITTEPAGAQVAIDGTLSGVTPLKIPALTPGKHRVTISSGQTSVDRTVQITPGATSTLLVSVPRVSSNGFIAIDAAVELQIFESGRLLGTGTSSRISLPAGRHTLELVNRSLGFRTEQTVEVIGGRSVTLTVPMPTGTLSINAMPWAHVWVDGRPIGQTPIGNLSVSLGTHEVIWRHPEHGERRQIVLVSAAEPVRLGVDWTR